MVFLKKSWYADQDCIYLLKQNIVKCLELKITIFYVIICYNVIISASLLQS